MDGHAKLVPTSKQIALDFPKIFNANAGMVLSHVLGATFSILTLSWPEPNTLIKRTERNSLLPNKNRD